MWSDNETDRDLLGFKIHVDLIKTVITNERVLPVSIGVFGDWGSGKSSIMKMLELDLNADDKANIICLYFNGWTFEGYDDAKAALIEDILIKLKENKKVGHKIKDEAARLIKSVDWLRAGGFLMKNVAKPALLAYATGGASLVIDAVDKAKDFFSGAIGNSTELITKVETEEGKGVIRELEAVFNKKEDEDIPSIARKFRVDFEKLINKTELKSLVILIDDLDRCTPERIIDNLEAIKLFLNVPKTAFIIGADERIVRHAIECRYKTPNIHSVEIERYKDIVTDYLEKLIQLPYRLPRLSNADVETYMTLLFCYRDLSDEDFNLIYDEFLQFREVDRHSAFNYENIKNKIRGKKGVNEKDVEQQLIMIGQIAPMITNGLKGNPRQIKRFLNTFTLRLDLASVANFELDERILAKLMVLEYIALSQFKELCDWQQLQNGKPKQILELENYINTPNQTLNSELKSWENDIIFKWVKMEPSLRDVNLMDYYWISRDKLENTINADAMIPQIIRLIYKSISTYTSQKSLNQEVDNIEQLSESEKNLLYGMIRRDLLEHPAEARGFEIVHAIINSGYTEMKPVYLTILQELVNAEKLNLVPPSVAVGLVNIAKFDSEFMTRIRALDASTKLGKAIGVNIKKK